MGVDGPSGNDERARQREQELADIRAEELRRLGDATVPEVPRPEPVSLSELGIGTSQELQDEVYGAQKRPRRPKPERDVADEARAEAQKIYDQMEAQKQRDKLNAEAIEAAERGDDASLDQTSDEPQP